MRYYIEKLGRHRWALIDKDVEDVLKNFSEVERLFCPHVETMARSIEELIRLITLIRDYYRSFEDADPDDDILSSRAVELQKLLDVVRVEEEECA